MRRVRCALIRASCRLYLSLRRGCASASAGAEQARAPRYADGADSSSLRLRHRFFRMGSRARVIHTNAGRGPSSDRLLAQAPHVHKRTRTHARGCDGMQKFRGSVDLHRMVSRNSYQLESTTPLIHEPVSHLSILEHWCNSSTPRCCTLLQRGVLRCNCVELSCCIATR
jgi:hypothetical protein